MGAVHVAGHLCLDLTPAWGEGAPSITPGQLLAVGPLRSGLGGSTSNTGRALLSLGREVSLSARLGGDDLGVLTRHLVEQCRWRRLDLAASPVPSSYTLVIEAPGMDRSFWHFEGANIDFTAADITPPAGSAAVHVGYPSLLPGLWPRGGRAFAEALQAVRRAGVGTSLDLAHVAPGSPAAQVDWAVWLQQVAPACDVLAGSSDDLSSALGVSAPTRSEELLTMAERVASLGPGVAIVSGGPLGFAAASGNSASTTPLARSASPSPWLTSAASVSSPATTTGAGDVLKAALIDALLAGLSLRQVTDRAAEVTADYVRTGRVSPAMRAS